MVPTSRLLRISIVIVHLCCCFTAFSNDVSEIPNFYLYPPNIRGVVLGLGSGKSMEEAMNRAMQDVAVQLAIDVKVITSLTEKEATTNGESQSTSEIEITSVQKARSVLQNTKRIEHTVTRTGTYFVLVYYPLNSNSALDGSAILAEIRKKHQTNLVTTTVFSSLLPGSGQLMNRRYTMGSIMLAGSVGLLVSSTASFIGAQVDRIKSINATTELDEYRFSQQSQTKTVVGLVCLVLYAAEVVWSGIDNYSAEVAQ